MEYTWGEQIKSNRRPRVCLLAGELSSLLANRLLVPGDVPVAPELSALLGEMGHPLETEALVEANRGRVWQRDPGIRPVYIFTLKMLEQSLVQPRPGPTTNRLGCEVDAGLH